MFRAELFVNRFARKIFQRALLRQGFGKSNVRNMTPQAAVKKLKAHGRTDQWIADMIGNVSRVTILRIRRGEREARHSLGEALVKLAQRQRSK